MTDELPSHLRDLNKKFLAPPLVNVDRVVQNRDDGRVGVIYNDGNVIWMWDDEKAARRDLCVL